MHISGFVVSGNAALSDGGPPKGVSKQDLVDLRDRLSGAGVAAPAGLDKLIGNFDKAAGDGGRLSISQFKQFAQDNGVTLPDAAQPPPGGAPPRGVQGAGHGRPAGGPPAGVSAGAPGAPGASATSGKSGNTKDLTTESDADLQAAADKGDTKAAEELARRKALEARHKEAAVVDAVDSQRLRQAAGTSPSSVE